MAKLNAVLLVALLASSLLLVKSAYESRRLFAAIDHARAEHAQLEAEYKRLDAERQAQGTSLRVERTARERLGMRNATPGITTYVFDPAAAAASAAIAASAAEVAR
jgi:cell division protein FtsL